MKESRLLSVLLLISPLPCNVAEDVQESLIHKIREEHHQVIEWLGLEESLRSSSFNLPAMGRDASR